MIGWYELLIVGAAWLIAGLCVGWVFGSMAREFGADAEGQTTEDGRREPVTGPRSAVIGAERGL